jgi:hypothetical protein
VVRAPGPDSIPGATRFSEKEWVVSTTEELLEKKVAAAVYKFEITAAEIRHADHVAPFFRKININFADKRR